MQLEEEEEVEVGVEMGPHQRHPSLTSLIVNVIKNCLLISTKNTKLTV